MRKKSVILNPSVNLLDLQPERSMNFETHEDETVTILVPKFNGKILGKYLQPRLKHPYMHIHLDDFGSFVWNMCDGKTTVRQIGDGLRTKFGESVEPVNERLALFIRQLESSSYIKILWPPAGADNISSDGKSPS